MAGHIDHHAAITAVLAPAIGGIGSTDRADPTWLFIPHRQTVEVAVIFCGQAAEQRIHHYQLAI